MSFLKYHYYDHYDHQVFLIIHNLYLLISQSIILCWFAGLFVQMNQGPRVWWFQTYFFPKNFLKNYLQKSFQLIFYLFIILQKFECPNSTRNYEKKSNFEISWMIFFWPPTHLFLSTQVLNAPKGLIAHTVLWPAWLHQRTCELQRYLSAT